MEKRDFLKYLGLGTAMMTCAPVISQAAVLPASNEEKKKIKPISGSWFEFQHSSESEGGNWNKPLAKFTADQWRRKVFEIKEVGMDYLVLMSVALKGKPFYPSVIAPQIPMGCDDPLEAVLSAADECGIKFFVSNDFWADLDAYTMMIDKDVQKKRFRSMEEVAAKYAHHESFYGWYFPNEAQLQPYFIDECVAYVNECAAFARRLTPACVNLIAPYFIKEARFDDTFVRQLEKLNIDIIAYQDGVGATHTELAKSAQYYETLYKAHAKASRARLWADMELFYFRDGIIAADLLPASFEKRILKQMENISPYVDKILCYQYIGQMNKPGTDIVAGHPDSLRLYEEYINWYQKNFKAVK